MARKSLQYECQLFLESETHFIQLNLGLYISLKVTNSSLCHIPSYMNSVSTFQKMPIFE